MPNNARARSTIHATSRCTFPRKYRLLGAPKSPTNHYSWTLVGKRHGPLWGNSDAADFIWASALSTKPEHHCRIGKIRLRSGAEVRVLDPDAPREPQGRQIRRHMVEAAKFFDSEWPFLAGFVTIAWCPDGYWDMSYQVGKSSPFREVDLATFVGDRIRERTTLNATLIEMNKQNRGGR